MSLAQDLRNAWDYRDRDEFERLLTKVAELAQIQKTAPPPAPPPQHQGE